MAWTDYSREAAIERQGSRKQLSAGERAAIERGADLMGILTNLAENDVMFIDEVHRLPRGASNFLVVLTFHVKQ